MLPVERGQRVVHDLDVRSVVLRVRRPAHLPEDVAGGPGDQEDRVHVACRHEQISVRVDVDGVAVEHVDHRRLRSSCRLFLGDQVVSCTGSKWSRRRPTARPCAPVGSTSWMTQSMMSSLAPERAEAGQVDAGHDRIGEHEVVAVRQIPKLVQVEREARRRDVGGRPEDEIEELEIPRRRCRTRPSKAPRRRRRMARHRSASPGTRRGLRCRRPRMRSPGHPGARSRPRGGSSPASAHRRRGAG